MNKNEKSLYTRTGKWINVAKIVNFSRNPLIVHASIINKICNQRERLMNKDSKP